VHAAAAQPAYIPPSADRGITEGIPWSSAESVGARFQRLFHECDSEDTCDGRKSKHGCATDQNHNTALLRFSDGTIFFDAKMGLDADGSPYAKNTPGSTDSPDTSYRYSLPGRPSVDADKVPYIVVPSGGFAEELGIQLGDAAAVIYRGTVLYALVADEGLPCKIGEGSIMLHEQFSHRVCLQRNTAAECTKLRDVGIESNVLYFIFPSSNERLQKVTPSDVQLRVSQEGRRRLDALRLSGSN
jgi:Fungal chitosanase of glycosyl hydrolase group 75